MLIGDRSGMIAGAKLPYDAEVEYVYGAGGAYVDTGVAWDTEMAFDVTWYQRSKLAFAVVFGARDLSSAGAGYVLTGAGTANSDGVYKLHVDMGGRRTDTQVYGIANHWYRVVYTGSSAKVYRDDVLVNTVSIPQTSRSGTRTIYVCGLNNAGTINGYAGCGISHLALGSLRDFVPVRVGTSGYLYDRVSGQLFGNGDLTCGPDKS